MLGEALLVFWLLLENRLNRFYGFRPYWLCFGEALLVYAGYGLGFRFVALVYVTGSKLKQVMLGIFELRLKALAGCYRLSF